MAIWDVKLKFVNQSTLEESIVNFRVEGSEVAIDTMASDLCEVHSADDFDIDYISG